MGTKDGPCLAQGTIELSTKTLTMKIQTLSFTLLVAAFGCDVAPTSDRELPGPAPTKEEAREQAGKGDIVFDWCDALGWYGDGICDPFCADPDPDCEAPGECRPTGCSADICADQDVITTCEAVVGAECFADAICERQADGACGFTQTDASLACFDDLGGDDEPEEVWLAMAPTQCGTNPWEGGDVSQPELTAIIDHYRSVGLEFDEIGLLDPNEPMAVCFACSCPRGDTLLVHVSGDNVELAKDAGFAPTDVLGHETIQCGGNPWEQLNPELPEQTRLERWTREQGAFAYVGFVAPVEPIAVCFACSCPRGDVAVAVPGGEDDATILVDGGFERLD